MKSAYLLILASLALQTGLIAQPSDSNKPAPQLGVQIQKLPSSNEGNYYDNSAPPPQVYVDFQEKNSTQNDAGKGNSFSQTRGSDNRSVNSANDPYAAPKPDELRSEQKIERTLSILKPDAVRNRHIGNIISRFEDEGLRVAAIKMVSLTPEQASQFYAIHRDRPFFPGLVKFMSSGPVVVLVLEGNQAIKKNREIMGATDPKKAEKGTIRADFAESVSQNAVHGSDSPEAARQEIIFFFKPNEIYSTP